MLRFRELKDKRAFIVSCADRCDIDVKALKLDPAIVTLIFECIFGGLGPLCIAARHSRFLTAPGQRRKSQSVWSDIRFNPKAEIAQRSTHVRLVPYADIPVASSQP